MENDNFVRPQYQDSALTGKIIQCAMTVHSEIGNGFPERIYQNALAIELTRAGINFSREQEIDVSYKGIFVGKRRADFIIEGRIILETKALKELENIHLAQAINYLEAYKLKVGLLINFGSRRLQYKRLMNYDQQ